MIEDSPSVAPEADAAATAPIRRRDDYQNFCTLTDVLEASLVPQTSKEISAALGWPLARTQKRLTALAGDGGAHRAFGPTGFVYWRHKP